MNNKLTAFINEFDNESFDVNTLIKTSNYVVSTKGYGTPELEMKYLHHFFLKIQEKNPDFKSFSWQQSNCYNDNYNNFDLCYFTVNNFIAVESTITFYFNYSDKDQFTSEIEFHSIQNPDVDEIDFSLKRNIKINDEGISDEYWEEFYNYRKEKYRHLENPCLKFLAFLKLLEINFSMYYFLYVFGNGVEVEFDSQGITIKKIEDNENEGSPLGNGMEFD